MTYASHILFYFFQIVVTVEPIDKLAYFFVMSRQILEEEYRETKLVNCNIFTIFSNKSLNIFI